MGRSGSLRFRTRILAPTPFKKPSFRLRNGAAETTDAAPQSKGESDFNEQTDENVPDWFAAAQRKAKRSPQRPKPAQRSRYADALDAALSESAAIFDEANKLVFDESEDRMRARSADIV